MVWLSRWQLRRTSALLCVALMLIFALSRAAGIVNQFEHGHGTVLPHNHLAFSDLVVDDDHDHDLDAMDVDHHALDHDADHDDHAQADHDGHAAGHHHHGDVNSSLIVLASSSGSVTAWQFWKGDIRSDRLRLTTRQSLPERPPRTSQIAV